MLAKTEPRTVSEVTAGVYKSAALVRAEAQLTAARAKRTAAQLAVRALVGATHPNSSEINAAVKAEAVAEAEVAAVRTVLRPLRIEYADAVKAALAPLRRAAAERIMDLIADLRPELAVLDQSMSAIEYAGGQTVRVPPNGVDVIDAIARRIAS